MKFRRPCWIWLMVNRFGKGSRAQRIVPTILTTGCGLAIQKLFLQVFFSPFDYLGAHGTKADWGKTDNFTQQTRSLIPIGWTTDFDVDVWLRGPEVFDQYQTLASSVEHPVRAFDWHSDFYSYCRFDFFTIWLLKLLICHEWSAWDSWLPKLLVSTTFVSVLSFVSIK